MPRAEEQRSGPHKFQLQLSNSEILADFTAQKQSMKATCERLDKYVARTIKR